MSNEPTTPAPTTHDRARAAIAATVEGTAAMQRGLL